MVPGMFGGFAPRYFIGRPLPAFVYPFRGWGTYGPPYFGPPAYVPIAPPFVWNYAYQPLPAYPYGVPYVPYGGFYPYRWTYAYPSAVVAPVKVVPPVPPPWFNPAVTPVADWSGQGVPAWLQQLASPQQAGAWGPESAATRAQVTTEEVH